MRLPQGLLRVAGPGILGAIAALGQAPFGLWPLTLLAIACVTWMWRRTGGWQQAGALGWAVGTGYFGLALLWIVQPFLVDPWRHGWMAPFALVFMSAGLALFWALGFAAARRFGGVWALAGALTGAELLRAYLFTGFPWALIGHTLVDTPWAQVVSVVGAHGLGLLVFAGALSLLAAYERRWQSAVFGIVMLSAAWIWGAARLTEVLPVSPDRPVLRLVQPNAPQHQKWDPEFVATFFRRQITFTAEGTRRPDLIVWSETAVPFLLEDAERGFEIIADAAKGVPVVLGIERLGDRSLHNSAIMLGPDGQVSQIYDKHHLVPFGEYIPMGDWLEGLGLSGMTAKDGNGFAPGPGPRLMDLGPRLGRALPLICYEAVFPNDARVSGARPDFLMQLTNDAWFGTFSGPYQHLAQARLRAIEQGLPMVRVANTGVSAMVDAMGQVTAQIALGQAGWVDAALPAPMPPTLYARSGDWVMAVLAALITLASIMQQRAIGRRKPR